jgi:hypothetical protein
MGDALRSRKVREDPADALRMPPPKQILPFGATSVWPFTISDEDWKKLETHYGYAIPLDLRNAVVAKTQMMRLRSDAQQSALSTREAIRQIAGAKRTTVDWLKWMDGLSDEVRAMLMSVDEWERLDLIIKPFMNFVVGSCDEKLPDLESDLASKEAQDASHPWEDWIVELTGLFDQYGLPTSASKGADKAKPGRRPSKFVIFIRELQRLIEPQYRRHTHSDEALAAAVTRARSSREGDEARQDEPRESEQAPIGTRTEDPPSE